MADTKNSPGISGSDAGQIQTPMNSTNAGKKGGGSIKSYEGMPSTASDGNLVEGPGAKGNWSTQVTIKGNNLGKGKY